MTNAEPSTARLLRCPANDDRRIAGVAIDVDTSGETPLFLLQLLSSDLAVMDTVSTTADETAARRAWLLLARALRRRRFVAAAGGGFRALEQMTGHIVGRAPLARRGRRVPLRRRHFSRRQAAVLPTAAAARQ